MTTTTTPRTGRGARDYAGIGVALARGVVVVVCLRVALAFVGDASAPDRMIAGLLRAVGADTAAGVISQQGLTDLTRRGLVVAVALLVGTIGTWWLFRSAVSLVEQLGARWRDRLLPWVFIGPASALLVLYLVLPAAGTLWTSLTEDDGLGNYTFAFTDPAMVTAFRNNLVWLVVATGGSVLCGLAIAGLVDRLRRESLAKTLIFLPMAISMVGASVIWRFVYAWSPPGSPQVGALNAVVTSFGIAPIPWVQETPINTFALIVIMVWLQTGFAMVVLSAAIKGVPSDQLEAARLDGASEWQAFRHVVLPGIRGAIITVSTTVAIMVLKVFDIVFVMTGGRYETEVVANRMFSEMFRFRNFGRASAIAVLLFIAVVPIIVVNVRNLGQQGIDA
ncbi:MAG TPA: sugar ABC transporter permease [Euzebya sp.]|nr:sugar ABC transporter permease [Euzebya sp.]